MHRVRVGVLGAARVTPRAVITPAREVAGVDVVAVAARDRARAEAFAREHGIERVHAGYDELLADAGVDAVYNPLPNGLHGRWTLAALDAGKHVLCEKPFTANAAEAEAVAAVAARTGLVVMEAFHYRYHPMMVRAVELVRGGAIGRVTHLAARMVAVVPKRGDIRYRPDLAGGAVMDVGCYSIHQLRSLVGTEPTVRRARATTISPGVDRLMQAELEFADGVTATMTCALLAARAPLADVQVVGEHGSLRLVNPTHPQSLGWIALHPRVGRTRRRRGRGRPTFSYQLEAFRDALCEGTPTLTPPADSVATMRVIDAVYEAAGLVPRAPTV